MANDCSKAIVFSHFMEEYRTTVFVKSAAKSRRRQLYNLGILGAIIAIWAFCIIGLTVTNIRVNLTLTATIGLTVVLIGMKKYDDKYMGISAYGDREGHLIITRQYLEISEVRIPYNELTNLVIYVDEYLGMSNGLISIHHGGNNLIEFEHKGKPYSFNYIIKNKADYDRVGKLVGQIEKDPELAKHLKVL